jgi:hypothetical protein
MKLPSALRRLAPRAALAGGVTVCALIAGPAIASAASVSANWAGYVALPRSAAGSFQSVSGSWTQPAVSCTAGRQTYSAVWVGLGGYREDSRALEQIGSEADCSSHGQPNYTTWYELVPAAPITLAMKTTPGDQMTASVTVRDHDVTLRLRDLTSGARYSVTRVASAVDDTSAEWITEAPSSCSSQSSCQTLPLSDFGTVSFSSATVRAGSHTGPISDPDWSQIDLELRQGPSAGPFGRRHARALAGAALVAATPSSLSGSEGSFSVRWEELPLQTEATQPPPGEYGPFGRFRA